MLVVNHKEVYQQHLVDTDFLSEVSNAVMVVKDHINKWLFWATFTILAFTVGFVFASKYKKSRKRLVKEMNRRDFHITTLEQYNNLRTVSDRIISRKKAMKFFAGMHLQSLPLPVKFVLKPMIKFAATQLSYQCWIERQLDFYNRQQFCLESNFFTFKSEKQLRLKKVPTYDYWM